MDKDERDGDWRQLFIDMPDMFSATAPCHVDIIDIVGRMFEEWPDKTIFTASFRKYTRARLSDREATLRKVVDDKGRTYPPRTCRRQSRIC